MTSRRSGSGSRRDGRRASRAADLALLAASLVAVLGALEVWLRLHPPTEVQTNNEYRFRERTGERRFGAPLHSWSERFDPSLDVRGYYALSDYVIHYHFDQHGARWLEAAPRAPTGRVIVVLGDSFTYGSGLRYEDTWVRRLEEGLRADGRGVTLLDFGESAADTRRCLEIYRERARGIPHEGVLYGLYPNDLISFSASEWVRNEMLGTPFDRHSRLVEFVLGRLNRSIVRRAKLADLTSPAVFERHRFHENFPAIERLAEAASERGARFRVALLPVLIDLEAEGFRPVYDEILRRLSERGIEVLDATGSVRGRRASDLWILPVDQHANEIASRSFAERIRALWVREP